MQCHLATIIQYYTTRVPICSQTVEVSCGAVGVLMLLLLLVGGLG